jgi:hypothetical protein
MDDDLHSLEAELTGLRPAAPSRELLARLEADLAPATIALQPTPAKVIRRASPVWWMLAGALPMAAALLVVFFFTSRRAVVPTTSAPSPSVAVAPAPAAAQPGEASVEQIDGAQAAALFKPVAAENVLYAVADEGLVTLEDGTAARRERLNYVDTITWRNPRTNASVRWTVPREEVRVVPVKFQ